MIQTADTHDVQNDTIEINSSAATQQTTTLKDSSTMKPKTPIIAVILIVAILSGIGTGFGIHKLNAKDGSMSLDGTNNEAGSIKEQTPTSNIKVGDVYGSSNESTFKDSAEGIIQAGGIDGEGTHKLIRTGGYSQTVYLSSAVIDLDKFINAKVKVWGETNTAQKAGWLMDVGRAQVIELNAEIPEESKPTPTPTPKPSKVEPTSATKKKATPVETGE